MVTVDEFAEITKRVIARDGFDDYLPTAIYPRRSHIVVLDSVPGEADPESIATSWAAKGALDGEEYLVAFKVSSSAFKVIRRDSSGSQEGVFDVTLGDV